jgi:hypothetical protein
VFSHVVRILASETSGNLFGRAPAGQVSPDVPPQPGVQEFARSSRLTPPGRRQRVPRTGPIRLPPGGVAGKLAAHGAGRSPQDRGHRSQRLPLEQAQAQGLTFFETQVCIKFLWHGNTLADYGLKCCTWN